MTRPWRKILSLLSFMALAATASLFGEDRFPRPEFESGYLYPPEIDQTIPWGFLPVLDILLLVAALAGVTFAVLRRRSRRLTLFLAAVSLLYFGFIRHGCTCSVGSLQNVAQAFFEVNGQIPLAVLLIFLLPLLFSLFFGRGFCGGVCPLGALQEVVNLYPLSVPRWLSAPLSVIPVAYLGVAVLHAAAGGVYLICRADPFVGFFRFSSEPWMLLYSGLFLLSATVVFRPYCRFLCPYGVLLGWTARFSRWQVRVSPLECVGCRLCEEVCPVDAIEAPVIHTSPQGTRARIRRLLLTLALLPLILGGFLWLGDRLHPYLARQHPVVALNLELMAEEAAGTPGLTRASSEFHTSARDRALLAVEAGEITGRFRLGGLGLGLFLGTVLVLRLGAACLLRHHAGYRVNPVRCIQCARCYSCCPEDPANRLIQPGEENSLERESGEVAG